LFSTAGVTVATENLAVSRAWASPEIFLPKGEKAQHETKSWQKKFRDECETSKKAVNYQHVFKH
jgi:hypothetical protein